MVHKLEDLSDEEYDQIMEARNRARKATVVRTIMGRVPQQSFNSGARRTIESWLTSMTFEELEVITNAYRGTTAANIPAATIDIEGDFDEAPAANIPDDWGTVALRVGR